MKNNLWISINDFEKLKKLVRMGFNRFRYGENDYRERHAIVVDEYDVVIMDDGGGQSINPNELATENAQLLIDINVLLR